MFSPAAQDRFEGELPELRKLTASISQIVKPLILAKFQVPTEDIACSALNLVYTEDEADVQIEIRYTTGMDVYEKGKEFDPPRQIQDELRDSILSEVGKYLVEYGLNCSAWTTPYRDSSFGVGKSAPGAIL